MSEIEARDGVKLYAEVHGDGDPLLLSCGMCTTHKNFHPQIEALTAAGSKLILWDYRGHGLSEAPADPAAYTLDHVLDDLGRVLDWASPDTPAVIGGHSFGGLTALHYALRRPDRVRALLLLDSGPGFKNPKALERWRAQTERTASFLEAKGMRAFVRSKASITAIGIRPELPAAKVAADAIAAQDPQGLAHFARHIAGPAAPVIDQLAEIGVPALVVVGEKDEPYLRAAEVMAARLLHAEQVTIPAAGHLPNIEEAEAFNAALIRFLAKLP